MIPDFKFDPQPNQALAPEEPNVYSLRGQPMFGAPAERNVLVDEYVEPYNSLRWSEETLLIREFYKHSVPPGLSDLARNLRSFRA